MNNFVKDSYAEERHVKGVIRFGQKLALLTNDCAAAISRPRLAAKYAAGQPPIDPRFCWVKFARTDHADQLQKVYLDGYGIGEIVSDNCNPQEFILFLSDSLIGNCPQLDLLSTVWMASRCKVSDTVQVAIHTAPPHEIANLYAAAVKLDAIETAARNAKWRTDTAAWLATLPASAS